MSDKEVQIKLIGSISNKHSRKGIILLYLQISQVTYKDSLCTQYNSITRVDLHQKSTRFWWIKAWFPGSESLRLNFIKRPLFSEQQSGNAYIYPYKLSSLEKFSVIRLPSPRTTVFCFCKYYNSIEAQQERLLEGEGYKTTNISTMHSDKK